MHSLRLKNQVEWRAYSKSMSKPADIPATPEKVYRKEWKGMGEFLTVMKNQTLVLLLMAR